MKERSFSRKILTWELVSSPTRRILGLRPVWENLLRAALTALGSSVEMVRLKVLLAEVCTRWDFVGEQLKS